jgi:hypothetical protein
VWAQTDATINSCPAPTVTSAAATSPSTVQVNFSRAPLPASVAAAGTQFTFDNGLVATAATVTGRSALVTTTTQVPSQAYVVTVANTVTDGLGTPLGTPNSASFTSQAANVCTAPVVISQLFGGNGPANGYPYDYVELHNRGDAGVDLSGWSIQYASATSVDAGWGNRYNFPADSGIAAGGYALVAFAGYDGGGATPDFVMTTSALNLSGTTGKLALVSNTTPLGTPPAGVACTANSLGTGVVDLVGYGPTSNCFEGAPAPAASATTALFRNASGCFDSNGNGSDFTAGTPAPRNASTTALVCTCP